MKQQELIELALGCGLSQAGELNMAALEFLPEVRQMCAADRCQSYGKCWTCPPHCGTLEDATRRAEQYSRGVLVQTTGPLEDSFDLEGMMALEERHKGAFFQLVKAVRAEYPSCLPMAAGACQVCPQCSCPEAPCRFPHQAIPSMEAYGLFVSKVCEQSGMKYYYGPNTMTYTSCVLVE